MRGVGAVSAVEATSDTNHPGIHRLAGWSIRETASAAAEVRLRDDGVAGNILATISLPADSSDHFAPLAPVSCSGVYVEVVAGAVETVIYSA